MRDAPARLGREDPRRRWRITHLGHTVMSAAIRLREEDFPTVFLQAAARPRPGSPYAARNSDTKALSAWLSASNCLTFTAAQAACMSVVLSQGAPSRRRVERRLPALSSRRGPSPTQDRRCAELGKRVVPSTRPRRPARARRRWLTPGMVVSRATDSCTGASSAATLPSEVLSLFRAGEGVHGVRHQPDLACI